MAMHLRILLGLQIIHSYLYKNLLCFDEMLSSCCIVNLKVPIIKGGGGGYVINKQKFVYPPPLLSLWFLKSSKVLEF